MSSKLTETELFEIIINSTDEIALKELFELRTNKWSKWISYDTKKTGAMDDLIRRLGSKHSYDYIPYAVKIVLNQKEINLFITSLAMLANLVYSSNTTEIPSVLSSNVDIIDNRVNSFADNDGAMIWKSILKWYRIEK